MVVLLCVLLVVPVALVSVAASLGPHLLPVSLPLAGLVVVPAWVGW